MTCFLDIKIITTYMHILVSVNPVRFGIELKILSLLTGGSFIALHNHIVLIVFLWNLLLKVSYEKTWSKIW